MDTDSLQLILPLKSGFLNSIIIIRYKSADSNSAQTLIAIGTITTYPTNLYPLPITVSMYPSPILRLSEYTTFATAAPQCSGSAFQTAS